MRPGVWWTQKEVGPTQSPALPKGEFQQGKEGRIMLKEKLDRFTSQRNSKV